MAASACRVLLLADTHLGFDLPSRPRVERRRRGPDFFDNCRRALGPAREGRVDLVVHGGDLLFRSRVPSWLVRDALEPFLEVADRGVPVFLVPGNHERSKIPAPLYAVHPGLHVFDRPRTFLQPIERAGTTVALSGFPFSREIDRETFARLLRAAAWDAAPAGIRLLCVHQAIEGARVGVQDYLFRPGPEVLAGRDLPRGFAAVLAGHIHRAQALTADLRGRPLPAPVFYPGATERTSFAEREETKGSWLLDLAPTTTGGRVVARRFVPLPTRPMAVLERDVTGLGPDAAVAWLRAALAALAPDAVVKVRLLGATSPELLAALSAPRLRELAPPTMNVDLAPLTPPSHDRRGPG
jgi:DNA repair exonuclease SbcCD nuclease subunit